MMLDCWGGSSAGRASRSQCEGREFDPPPLHQRNSKGSVVRPGPFCFWLPGNRGRRDDRPRLGRQPVDKPERRHRQRGECHRDDRENRRSLAQQREDHERQRIERAGQQDHPSERCIPRAAFEARNVARQPRRDITGDGHARGQAQHRIQNEEDDLSWRRIGRRHGECFWGERGRRTARRAHRSRQPAGCVRFRCLATTARRPPSRHPRPKLGRFGSYVHPGTR